MADQKQFALLRDQGVRHWNKWRRLNRGTRPDLRDAIIEEIDLAGVNFRGANLSGAYLQSESFQRADLRDAQIDSATFFESDLTGSNLTGAYLPATDFQNCTMQRVRLSSTDLSGAYFGTTDLSGARFDKAYLLNAVFEGAELNQVDFESATLGWTVFANVGLNTTTGLDTIEHQGPSTIGIDSLYKSSGAIPEHFLRGCGVPETMIQYARALVGSLDPILFYSCFISHSTKDEEFAHRLHSDLQSSGVRCWFAKHDIRGGRKIYEQIDAAIRVYDRLLLILSEHSMNSEWVKTEISNARQREMREKRQLLFPISLVPFAHIREWTCFDADTGKDSAREIREYFIPDFSNWKSHDSYKLALEQLLRDLKLSERH